MSSIPNTLQDDEPEGLYLKTSYVNDFEHYAKSYHNSLCSLINAFKSMEAAKDDMDKASIQVELSVINENGGNEKNVGSTEAARQRAYDFARSKSTAYTTARKFYLEELADYKYYKSTTRLYELRLQFLRALADK